ncbi:MAG: hypothetical protein HY708_05490 [Ignavibacteriae bacterium]|nr:hypothetical protein [Ignavibacteriota bacterium]
MAMFPGRIPALGIALIVVGTMMILERSGMISLEWTAIAWAVLALYGAQKLLTGFSQKRRGKVFWGTMFLLFGSFQILSKLEMIDFRFEMMLPIILIMVGMSIFAMYVANPAEWHLVIPAFFFIALGSVIVFSEMGYLDRWEVASAVKNYWPVALIVFGGALIARSRRPIRH